MIRLKDNIQNGLIILRILHVPNKNGSTDGLGQIAFSAESCYQVSHVETGHWTKGFYNHDNIIMSH